jgi:putative secretion ATPase (PEP-CTERM system associated)
MAYLEYGLHQNEGFIVITGEVGAGKTLLVRSLLEKLDPKKIVAANLVSTQIDADDILRLVAAAFGIPSKHLTKSDLLLAIEAFLVSTTAAGKRALLIVDEAQNLTPQAVEELRMLSNFQLEDHALLQSFLVGQPEFRAIMQSPEMVQLRQRVIASYHLGPLDLQETHAYIEHRLSCVGWKGNPSFDQEAMREIFNVSQGIPRRINAVCDRIMLAPSSASSAASALTSSIRSRPRCARSRSRRLRCRPTHFRPGPQPSSRPRQPESTCSACWPTPRPPRCWPGRAAFDTARFEERLAVLERTLSTTLNALGQLLKAAQQQATTTESGGQGK